MSNDEFLILGFDDVPPFATNIVQLLGLAAINWAKLEQQLDMLLLNINRPEYNIGNYRQIPNTSFDMKRKLFKAWFVKDPRLAFLHARGKKMYKALGNAAEDRHLLLHSSVQDFIEGPPVVIRIKKIHFDQKRGELTVSHGPIREERVKHADLGFSRLTKGMAHLCTVTMNDAFRQSLEKSANQARTGIHPVRHTKRIICSLARRLVQATCQ